LFGVRLVPPVFRPGNTVFTLGNLFQVKVENQLLDAILHVRFFKPDMIAIRRQILNENIEIKKAVAPAPGFHLSFTDNEAVTLHLDIGRKTLRTTIEASVQVLDCKHAIAVIAIPDT
jgi:hypothetical protein